MDQLGRLNSNLGGREHWIKLNEVFPKRIYHQHHHFGLVASLLLQLTLIALEKLALLPESVILPVVYALVHQVLFCQEKPLEVKVD